jgi:hypothetical protein
MCGSATFAAEVSITSMIVPDITAATIIHLSQGDSGGVLGALAMA